MQRFTQQFNDYGVIPSPYGEYIKYAEYLKLHNDTLTLIAALNEIDKAGITIATDIRQTMDRWSK